MFFWSIFSMIFLGALGDLAVQTLYTNPANRLSPQHFFLGALGDLAVQTLCTNPANRLSTQSSVLSTFCPYRHHIGIPRFAIPKIAKIVGFFIKNYVGTV